jgi:hypothetical protein
MRSFRKRLQRALVAVPLAAGCSTGTPPACDGASCAIVGASVGDSTTGGGGATTSSSTTIASTYSSAFGSHVSQTYGGGGTTGFTGPHTCSIADAGPTCPLCICTDLYSEVSGKDAGPVASCGCDTLCGRPLAIGQEILYGCTATDLDGGAYGIDCYWALDCGSGRRPAGLVALPRENPRHVGTALARAAHLEAAAVVAFHRLAEELRGFEAPPSLVSRALHAARDEVRHARALGLQARRHGGRVARVRVSAPVAPSLESWAVENAVEGCVGETWGAAVADWQARHARDPGLRQDYRRIALDEGGHAELAWDLAQWVAPRLTVGARRRVREARRRALEGLTQAPDASPEVARALGLPSSEMRRHLWTSLNAEIWNSPH